MSSQTNHLNYDSGISIVVPTENRAELTSNLLEALASSRANFAYPSEVLIIDSSDAPDHAGIALACSKYEARLIDGPDNVRDKRNLGISNARYSVVLFLDSDCRPTPDLLMVHWVRYTNERIGGVLGVMIFEGDETFAWRMMRDTSFVARFGFAERSDTTSWGPTANISFRKHVLDTVGTFDSSFPFKLGGDDLDLSYRVTQAGFTLVCEPQAIVYHSRKTWSSLQAVIGRVLRWGRMEYFLYAKHKDARVWSPPSFWGWALLVLTLLCLQSIILQRLSLLALYPLWAILAILFFSMISSWSEPSGNRKRIRLFGNSLLAAIPELTYQLGTTIEFLRHGDLRFLWSRAWFEPEAPRTHWLAESWNMWSNTFALLICQLFLMLVR